MPRRGYYDVPEPEDEDLDVTPLEDGQQQWYKSIAIDKNLLVPTATSRKIKVAMPNYETKKLAILIINPRDGQPFYTAEGYPYYQIQEQTVFTGYVSKEIPLPGHEIYNIDLTSSYLSEYDVPALRSLISLYSDLQLQTMQGKDRTEDMYYVYSKIMGMVDTAKSRDGRTARLSKTTITEGTNRQQIIDEFRQEEKKKRWIPGQQQ